MSPYCIKVETYLRMTELPYRLRGADPRKAPKGKIPFIDDEGTVVADSSLILAYLKDRYGDSLDSGLSAEQWALGHAVQRMLEEGSYWVGLYARWLEPEGYVKIKALLAPLMPPVLRRGILPLLRRGVAKAGHLQGTTRHSRHEIYTIGKADLTSVSKLLGDKPFLLGEQPRSFDATVYAFLISLLWAPFADELRAHVAVELPNLEAYCRRMKARYWDNNTPAVATAAA